MTAAELLPAMRADGVTLFVTQQGALRYRGDQATVARWLPEIRAHKSALIAYLTTAANDDADRHHTWLITTAEGERFSSMFCPPLSLAEVQARYPDAQVERAPDPGPAPTLPPDVLEVVYSYLRAVGETDLATGQQFIDACARDPAQLRGLYEDVVRLGLADWPDAETKGTDLVDNFSGTAKAICSRCTHWTPNPVNAAGGIGRCLAEAPASKRVGSLWPGDGVIRCREFREVQP